MEARPYPKIAESLEIPAPDLPGRLPTRRIELRSEARGDWTGQAPDLPGCSIVAGSRREALEKIRIAAWRCANTRAS